MKYQEIKIGETYLYNNNKEYTVLYKHDETQSVFVLDAENNSTINFYVGYFVDFKPKVKLLFETGLLRGSKGSLIYRTDETRGYGFDSYGKFGASFFCTFNNDWKEATKEDYLEFKELVIKHLKSLGFNDGDSFYSLFAWGNRNINFGGDIGFNEVGIYIDNIYVYCENKWVQPISASKAPQETETKEKLKALLNQMKDLLDSM